MYKPKHKVGDRIIIGEYIAEITVVDKFGPTEHYGFFTSDPSTPEIGFAGWIPCRIADSMN